MFYMNSFTENGYEIAGQLVLKLLNVVDLK